MTSSQRKRHLAGFGCTFEPRKGGSGYMTVRLGSRSSTFPAHGSCKELGTGLAAKIMKDLGLKKPGTAP